jgi:RNA-binding protein
MRKSAPKVKVDKKELVAKQAALSGKQRRQLRALGHHLKPVVQVGAQGITEQVIAATQQALRDHELIKVKIAEGPQDRHETSSSLAVATGAELAQLLGRTALLFRARKQDSKIPL